MNQRKSSANSLLEAPSFRVGRPQFTMLTKNPVKAKHKLIDFFYQFGEKFFPSQIPQNWWIGVSIESSQFTGRIDELRNIPTNNRFVSFEPLLKSVTSEDFPLDLTGIKQVIIGAQTNPSIEVTPEMVQPIGKACQDAHNIPMFCKDSMPMWAVRRELVWPLHKSSERPE